MKFEPLGLTLVSLALVALSAPALSATYTPKSGETLMRLFPQEWKQVCKLNKFANCNRILAGKALELPDGVTPRKAKVVTPKAAKSVTTGRREVKQEQSCIDLGAAPFNKYGSMKLRLEGIDLNPDMSAAEKDEAKRLVQAGRGERKLITKDMVFEAMPFRAKDGQVKFLRNVCVRTPEQGGRPEAMEVWKLSTGRLITDLLSCGNITTLPPKEEPPAPPAPPASAPPPPPAASVPAPEAKPEPKPEPPRVVTEVPKLQGMVCDHLDPAAVIGQEHEVSRDASHSTFATASVYCLKPFQTADSKTGAHGFGAKATYSNWHGTVNNHTGHYQGWNALVGPAYKRVMDEGYDWEVSVGPGKQVEHYHQAAYASRREFNLVGVTAGYNDYRRRLAGETWDVERQYFSALTLPVGRKVEQSIFGQPLGDTAEIRRFNVGFQAGGRWWFYEDPDQLPVLPYLQGGVFVQHPTSASASARIGLSDLERIAGVGCGFDKDLQHGGDFVPACGWWLDVVRGFTVTRAKFRKAHAITEAAKNGITVEERGGFIQVIRFGEPPPK